MLKTSPNLLPVDFEAAEQQSLEVLGYEESAQLLEGLSVPLLNIARFPDIHRTFQDFMWYYAGHPASDGFPEITRNGITYDQRLWSGWSEEGQLVHVRAASHAETDERRYFVASASLAEDIPDRSTVEWLVTKVNPVQGTYGATIELILRHPHIPEEPEITIEPLEPSGDPFIDAIAKRAREKMAARREAERPRLILGNGTISFTPKAGETHRLPHVNELVVEYERLRAVCKKLGVLPVHCALDPLNDGYRPVMIVLDDKKHKGRNI